MLSLLKRLFGSQEVQQTTEIDRFRAMKSRSESVAGETNQGDLLRRARVQKLAQPDTSLVKKEDRNQSPWSANGDTSMRVYDRRKAFK
jgi:hypothetical protein